MGYTLSMMLSESDRGPRHHLGGGTLDVVSAVLSMCSDAFVLLRPVRNPDGGVVDFVCVLANQVLETIVGVSNNDVVGRRLAQFLPEIHDQLPSLVDVLETGSTWSTAMDLHHAGLRRSVSVRATLVSTGRQDDVMLALNDRTEVHRLVEVIDRLGERQHELEIQALHDPLTGCANRLLIKTRLEYGISRLDRHSGSLAVLFIDLDRFKDVNDAHGHAVGDAVLTTMADRLRSQARPYDTVGRLGGDEFVVVCEDLANQDDVDRLTRRIVASCGAPIDVDGDTDALTVTVRVSVGVALADAPDTDPTTLIGRADQAMYRAKSVNGGGVAYYDEQMQRRLAPRHDIEIGLAAAIEEDRLIVDFEPVIATDDQRVVAAQSTVHWRHDVHGPIDVVSVCRTADGDDVAARLVDRVIDRAARLLSATAATANPRCEFVIVDVTGAMLCNSGFVDRVVSTLRRHGVAPSALCVAIDGVDIARHAEHARAVLAQLHDLGVRIARDKIGAPGTPLIYFDDIAIDYARLDVALVSRLDDPDHRQLVALIIEGLKAVGRTAIVPAVDTAARAADLKDLGVSLLHGPYATNAATFATPFRPRRSFLVGNHAGTGSSKRSPDSNSM